MYLNNMDDCFEINSKSWEKETSNNNEKNKLQLQIRNGNKYK